MYGTKHLRWWALVLSLLLAADSSLIARQNSGQTQPDQSPSQSADRESSKAQKGPEIYTLSSNYSVDLAPDWVANTKSEIPPPAPLGPYAPPFHLSGNLVLL